MELRSNYVFGHIGLETFVLVVSTLLGKQSPVLDINLDYHPGMKRVGV